MLFPQCGGGTGFCAENVTKQTGMLKRNMGIARGASIRFQCVMQRQLANRVSGLFPFLSTGVEHRTSGVLDTPRLTCFQLLNLSLSSPVDSVLTLPL